MTSDFLSLLERLAKAGVEFVVIGGFAGIVHGCTYVTQDVDVCCDFSADNLLALQDTLSGLHPVHRMTPDQKEFRLNEQDCVQLKNLHLDTDIGQLACVSEVDGLGKYREVAEASEVIEIGGVAVHVLRLDSLIRAKKAMNRPRDKQALLELQSIKKLREEQA